MKTPLPGGEQIVRAVLLEHWQIVVTSTHFIPVGDSAYSYRVETQSGDNYCLKIVDQRTAAGRRTAAHMDFSLLLQRLVAEHHFAQMTAPLPQLTVQGTLYTVHDALFFALYTFIAGESSITAWTA